MKEATTVEEYEAIGLMSDRFIRSRTNWRVARDMKRGVINQLSEAALEEFEASMTFSKISGSLKTARCEKIAHELKDDLPKFFQLFGIDPTILGTFYPYQCMGKRGCVRKAGFYCFQIAGDPCTNGN